MRHLLADPVALILLFLIALSLCFLAALFMVKKPKVALVFWLAVLASVPFWFQLPVLPVPPATVAFLIILPAVLRNSSNYQRIIPMDLFLAAILMIGAVSVSMFGTQTYAVLAIILQWIPGYLVGRRLCAATGLDFAYTCVASIGFFVAIWAIFEYAFDWHVFEATDNWNSRIGYWANIQERGGVARSEAAFGHGIAMGAFLSLCLPFSFTIPRIRMRIPVAAVIILGTLTCLSRGPILSAFVALILSLFVLRSSHLTRSTRVAGLICTAIAIIVAGPLIFARFESLNYDFEVSTEFRYEIWSRIPGDLVLIGQAHNVAFNLQGQNQYLNYRSIDSAPLLIGLDFGWLMVGILALLMGLLIFRVVIGRATVPDVALIAQIPTLLTAALITQYATALWFIVGLSALTASIYSRPKVGQQDSEELVVTDLRGRPTSGQLVAEGIEGSRSAHDSAHSLTRRGHEYE